MDKIKNQIKHEATFSRRVAAPPSIYLPTAIRQAPILPHNIKKQNCCVTHLNKSKRSHYTRAYLQQEEKTDRHIIHFQIIFFERKIAHEAFSDRAREEQQRAVYTIFSFVFDLVGRMK